MNLVRAILRRPWADPPSIRATLCAVLVAVAGLPGAARPEAPSPAEAAPAAPERLKLLGVELDVGFPDGAALSVVYRPWYFLRLNAGPAYDLAAFGVQGGATLIPFHFPITPTLTGEAAYFAGGNVNKQLARWNVSAPSAVQPLLNDVGYSYLSSQLGLEFGGPEVFVFYIRFGLAWIFPNASGTATTTSGTATVTVNGIQGRFAAPTGNVGFVVYIW